MEGKERYKLVEEDLAYAIVDKETHKTYQQDSFDFDNICDLLNQQDKRIRELEEKIVFAESNAFELGERAIISVMKENKQLKQELKDERAELQQLYSHLEVEAFGEDIQEQAVKKIDKIEEENQQLKQQLAEWQDGTIICKWTNAENKVKELKQQVEELNESLYQSNMELYSMKNLRHQLHDLPKKIVEEIRKEIELPLYVHPDFDEFECIFDIDKLLDTILKKYGGEK